MKNNKIHWIYFGLFILMIFLLATIFGPCNSRINKEGKLMADSLAARIATAETEKNIIIDSLNKIADKEKKSRDSLFFVKLKTDNELADLKTKSAVWRRLLVNAKSNKDTIEIITSCDSIAQSNMDLIGVAEHYKELIDSADKFCQNELNAKDEIINTQVDFDIKLRTSFDDLKTSYDNLYESQRKLNRKYSINKVKQKLVSAVAIAGITYFIIHTIKK